MKKKYIIANDVNLHLGELQDEIRHFAFTKKNMYDTIEEAEARIVEVENKRDDESKLHRPIYYTIMTIYTKE